MQEHETRNEDRDEDSFSDLINATMYDRDNPIHEWLDSSMIESEPILDEEGEPPIPSKIVVDAIPEEELEKALDDQPLKQWTKTTIGKSHLGKRKYCS